MSKKLLFSITKKDLTITYFSGTGGGGQHRNKHQNCVRMSHKESNARVTGQSHKERQQNLREAFKNLQENAHFKLWFNRKCQEALTGTSVDEKVEKAMHPDNIKVEGKEDGRWKLLADIK